MRTSNAENLHYLVEAPLHPVNIGIWSALSGTVLIAPIIFHGTINDERYRNLILEPLSQLHDDVITVGYFQLDGAPDHAINVILNYLVQFYDDDRINSRTVWPPIFPDLDQLDFTCKILQWKL